MRMSGARVIVECIIEQGVDTVFGYPGGTVLNIYDELYKHADRLRHVLTSHEQGAAHAADGYARASGRTGVVIATSGPGATNLVTGIATAYMDSVPMVAITGSVPRKLKGKDSFQEIDIAGITMPITKHNFVVKEPGEIASTIRRAFEIAASGRPGPVLVDIPKDLTAADSEWSPQRIRARSTLAKGAVPAGDIEIEEAAELIAAARRPFIVSGGGVIASGASEALAGLAETLDAPVAVTLMGQGSFPAGHPLSTGMIGMHGTRASNNAVRETDLLIAIGMRFSDRVIGDASRFAKGSHILHIDVDPSEIGKNIRCYRSLVGDVSDILARLSGRLKPARRPQWLASVAGWRREVPVRPETAGLAPRAILESIHEAFGDETIIATEVGQHQIWTAQYYPFSRPRTFISSCGLGTMGFGTGAAIGAQMARPDSRVVHVAGDGSFRMNCAELATIARYDLPITIVVVNNGTLGMVRQWQTLFYGKRYSQTDLDRPPDFVKLADAYGIAGVRPGGIDELREALSRAARGRAPLLVDCRVGIDENVLPIVPPGKPIDEQIMQVD
ncbi:MAG: biosynthetic-type acetolactate synthase large subunit [Spirochaetes bacterium]|nr:biosynthetic-type acetolactate synthase large subunit [Spirochaetota bacterium]MBU1080178.1 biosynthetic-type acetolactate synthase large subunit [Spirochaetota bacterium]